MKLLGVEKPVTSSPAKYRGRPPGTVSYVAAYLPGGKGTFMEYARWSDDPKVQTLLQLWDDLGEERQRGQNLDALCQEVGIPGPELVGIVAANAMVHNRHAAAILAAVSVPSIVQTNIDEAKKAEGYLDRKMFLEHTGILPTRGGIAINNQILNASGIMAGSPQEIFHDTIQRGAALARESDEG